MSLFMISCNKEALPTPSAEAKKTHPALPKTYELVQTFKVLNETHNKEVKLEKGKVYNFRLDGKDKESKSYISLFNNNKKVGQSVVNKRYYNGLAYRCGKTDYYKVVVNRDTQDEALSVVIGSRLK